MKSLNKVISAILLMGCFSLSSVAEKVKLGEFIIYEGKVDASGVPNGKGKIETTYGSNDPNALTKEKDLLEGIFENGQVKNAKLLLRRYNGPLWINSAKFKGTLEYAIGDKGTSITYKMIDGVFSTSKLTDFTIDANSSFSITRTPHSVGCDMEATKLYVQEDNEIDIESGISDLDFSPFQLTELGNVKKFRGYISYGLNSDFSEYLAGRNDIAEFENGSVLTKGDAGAMYRLPNEDFFIVELKSNNYLFKKTFPEGVLSYQGGEFYRFSGNNGEKGLIIRPQQDASTDIFKSVMNSTSLQSTGYSLYQGEIAILMEKASLGNAQAQYDLAMAYLDGNGIVKDDKTGQYWLDKAKENGNEQAIAYIKAKESKRAEIISSLSPVGKWTEVNCPGPDTWHESPIITRNERQCIWKFNPNQTVTVISHMPHLEDIDGTRVYITYSLSCVCATWKKNGNKIILDGYPNRRDISILGTSIRFLDEYSTSFQQKIKAAMPNIKKKILSNHDYDQISGTILMTAPDRMELTINWQNPYTNRKDILTHRFSLKKDTEGMTAAQKTLFEKQMSLWNESE